MKRFMIFMLMVGITYSLAAQCNKDSTHLQEQTTEPKDNYNPPAENSGETVGATRDGETTFRDESGRLTGSATTRGGGTIYPEMQVGEELNSWADATLYGLIADARDNMKKLQENLSKLVAKL